MKAVVIAAPGGVEGLEIQEVETPSIQGSDQVRVRVHAAALNRADLLQRRGYYPAPPAYPQTIPGLEFAGEVDSVGSRVRGWKKGQRVFGITGGGAQAEYLVVPESYLAEVPPNLDWVGAGAVPEVFITAHDALFTRARLQAGETMLVHAAGSGVGTAAIQLARVRGAQVVGTSRTAEKIELAKDYGLDTGVVAKDGKFAEAVKEWTEGQGVDVIIDLVGAAYFEENLDALASKGRMVLVGTTAGAKSTLDLTTVMRKRLTIIGTVLRGRDREEKAAATRLFATEVVPLLAEGRIRPVVDRVYKLQEIREAHLRLESNASFGKIVLVMS